MMFDCGLQNIFQLKSGQSRSINWENRNGEKGKGGMASLMIAFVAAKVGKRIS